MAQEIVANKGSLSSVYRLIGKKLYLKGVPSQEYYKLLGNFKQKHAIKSSNYKGGWVEIVFIDEIDEVGLEGEFFDVIEKYLKIMGYETIRKKI